MKILVTGGAGFIGSNFINFMLNKYSNYKIVCLDNLTATKNANSIKHFLKNKNFKFYKADITNRNKVYKIFKKEKPNIVVNFAAETHVDLSIKNPNIFVKTNVLGTNILLDACNIFNVSRFHQISTDEVYGSLTLNDTDLSFVENSLLKPSNPYSASKTAADLLCLSYFKTYKTPVTISRCSNNFGPYQNITNLIPLIILKALNNEKLPVYGNGLNIRDWIFVEDHCSAIDLIIHNGKVSEIYNIGSNNEKINLEVVKEILKQLNKSEDLITFVEDRKGHDLRYAINSNKIKNELNWEPKTNFNEGLSKTINWYKENKSWWKKVKAKGIK